MSDMFRAEMTIVVAGLRVPSHRCVPESYKRLGQDALAGVSPFDRRRFHG